MRTGGDPRNREHVERHVDVAGGLGDEIAAIGYDPQTSGGLLAAVDPAAEADLAGSGFTSIGRVVAGPARIVLH